MLYMSCLEYNYFCFINLVAPNFSRLINMVYIAKIQILNIAVKLMIILYQVHRKINKIHKIIMNSKKLILIYYAKQNQWIQLLLKKSQKNLLLYFRKLKVYHWNHCEFDYIYINILKNIVEIDEYFLTF